MIKAEFVKPQTDLGDVTFKPTKFGVFMLTAFGMGLGFGLMIHQPHWVVGLLTWLISFIGLLWSYSTRGKY